jgi:membrane protein insertase Oxa1/YidC/SpoIIIJ
MFPSGTFSAMLIQLPIASAIYQALGSGLRARAAFLWIADLSRPDAVVAIVAALLAGVAGAMSPPTANRMAIGFSTLLTLFFAWRLSASVGLYVLAANAIGVVQSKLVRRWSTA